MDRNVVSSADAASLGVQSTAPDPYKARVLKLVPAEVVAAYLSSEAMAKAGFSGETLRRWLMGLFVFFLVSTPVYLRRVARVRKNTQIVLVTLSYVAWIFAIGGVFATYGWYSNAAASIFLVLFAFLIPLVYKGR